MIYDKNHPIVSIIVPVYGVEKFIRRCLDSLISQTYKNIQIILIDDGSPDNSGAICDEYADSDRRIQVIHKENGGVASARQAGIDIAQGEYIIHADPDDWVETSMIEELVIKAQDTNADVVICDYYIYTHRIKRVCQRPYNLMSEKVLKEIFHRLHGSLWNKLLKRDCYIKYNLHFIPDINYCEDVLIWVQLLIHPEIKVAYLNKAFYYYFQGNVDSITHKWTSSFMKSVQNYHKALETLLPDNMKKELLVQKMRFTLSLWYNEEISNEELLSKHYRIDNIINCDVLRIKQKVGYVFAICNFPTIARYILNLRRFW